MTDPYVGRRRRQPGSPQDSDRSHPHQRNEPYALDVPTERFPEPGGYGPGGYGPGGYGPGGYGPGDPPPRQDRPARLASEDVVLAAPMSFTGSTQRLWKITRHAPANAWGSAAVFFGVLLLIAAAWMAVLCWYSIFGLWVVPYRVIRRGQRKRRMQELRHREMLTAMHQMGNGHPPPHPRGELPRGWD